MEDFTKHFQKKQNCQACLRLTLSLKKYSEDRVMKNGEIREQQNILYQLKENVRDLKIENVTSENGLKERARMWQRPSFYFTSIEDMKSYQQETQSISSLLPLVRPRKIKYEPIMEKDETKELDVETSIEVSGDDSEFEIPLVQPGCEVCLSLQEQIRKEIVELKMLKMKSAEKEREISEYKRQEVDLKQNCQLANKTNILRKEYTTDLSKYSSDSFQIQSSPSTTQDTEYSEFGEYPQFEEELEDNSMLSSFSALFHEYQRNKADMKALQTKQDTIVELLHSTVIQNHSDSLIYLYY